MSRVPVLHLEALAEVSHEPRVDERLASVVQPRLVPQGPHQDLEALPKRIVAEVLQTGPRRRGSHQLAL